MEMKIGSIFPWFGGKHTLASDIVEELGEHKAYWDLFCGSLAVPRKKPRSKRSKALIAQDAALGVA